MNGTKVMAEVMVEALRAFARNPGLSKFTDHINVLNASALLLEEAYAEVERLNKEREALRAALLSVQMDAVSIGGRENAISDATRSKVDMALDGKEAQS